MLSLPWRIAVTAILVVACLAGTAFTSRASAQAAPASTTNFTIKRGHYVWHAWSEGTCATQESWTAFWKETARLNSRPVALSSFIHDAAGTVLKVPACTPTAAAAADSSVSSVIVVLSVDSMKALQKRIADLTADTLRLSAKIRSQASALDATSGTTVHLPLWVWLVVVLLILALIAVALLGIRLYRVHDGYAAYQRPVRAPVHSADNYPASRTPPERPIHPTQVHPPPSGEANVKETSTTTKEVHTESRETRQPPKNKK